MTIPGISSSGCAKIIKKLEDHAVVYREYGENGGYFLADPLLAEFLRRF
jgi:DNA-binding IscR family transcriptional regulator